MLLEILTDDRSLRNNRSTEPVVEDGDEGGRNEVGTHQPLEAETRGQHGNNFAVARQLRGKKDDGNEHEQRREQIGKVRHEVGVLVEHNSP